MSTWQEACDKVTVAAEKAAGRPWGDDARVSPWLSGTLPGVRVTRSVEDRPGITSPVAIIPAIGGVVRGSERPLEDSAYIAIAANNADRLARFSRLLAEKLIAAVDCGDYVERHDCLDHLWEQSK